MMNTTDEAGYVQELTERLADLPKTEWPEQVTDFELELLRKHGVL